MPQLFIHSSSFGAATKVELAQASIDLAAAIRAGNQKAANAALVALSKLESNQDRLDLYRRVIDTADEIPQAINLTDK